MPTIPNQLSLNRRLPSGKSSIATYTTAKYTPNKSGFHDVAGALSLVGDVVDAQTDLDVSKAKSDFLVMKAGADGEVDNDEDHKTSTERYTTKVNTGLGNLSSTISDPVARQKFNDWARPSVATGIERAKKIAFNTESDYEIGGMTERLSKLREASITGGVTVDPDTGERSDPMLTGTVAANDMIDSMVAKNYIKASSAATMKQSFKQELAVGKLKMMEPEKRVEALKQPWAKNIPSDTHAVLLREAEADLIDDKAQRIVDTMFDKDMGLAEADAQARKINDADLRKEVEQRYAVMSQRKKIDTLTDQSDFVNEHWDSIRSGDRTIRHLKDDFGDEWDNLTASQQSNLYAGEKTALANGGGNSVKFNAGLEDHLNTLEQQRMYPELRKAYLDSSSSMSGEQNKRWSKISVDGVVPDDVKPLLNASQYVGKWLDNAKVTDKPKRASMMMSVDEFVNKETAANDGKPPSNTELQKFLDEQLVSYDPPGWGNSDPLYMLDDDERLGVVGDMQEESPDEYNAVVSLYSKLGMSPSSSRIISSIASSKEGDLTWALKTVRQKNPSLYRKVVQSFRQEGTTPSYQQVVDRYLEMLKK